MHDVHIPLSLRESVARRTGTEHPFSIIDPKMTALLIIDMQNYFCAPGYQGEVPMARQIVPAINRLAAAMREAGGHVVWIKGSSDGTADSWSVFNTYLQTPERRARRFETLSEAHEGHQIFAGLNVARNDTHVVKTRFSAFVTGSSQLDLHLRARGIDTIVVAGTTTDVCCDSTARDGSMLNYKSVMVSDATATYSDAAHNGALAAFYNVFGDVQTVDEVIASLAAGQEKAALAAL
jgi:ureidoacrylate peracid hydrolase